MLSRRTLALLALAVMTLSFFSAKTEETPSLRGWNKSEGYVYVLLGQYPQTEEGKVEPILWRVLFTDEDKAYLLSEYILFAHRMHPNLKEYRDVLKGDFAQTELCGILNGSFAETAFPDGELELLMPCGDFGKVFLASAEDVLNPDYGMGVTHKDSKNAAKIAANPGLRAWGTEYAIRNNGTALRKERLFVYSRSSGSCSPYWVHNQSTADRRHARCTKGNGSLGHIEAARDNEGVRPEVWLAQGSYIITGGKGTMEDPFTVAAKH